MGKWHTIAKEMGRGQSAYSKEAHEGVGPFHGSATDAIAHNELLGLLTALWLLAAPQGVELTGASLAFAALLPTGLLFGPTWLNPHCFRLSDARLDFGQFCQWSSMRRTNP